MEKYQAVARLSPASSIIAAATAHFVLLVGDMVERLLFMVAFGNCRRPAAQCLSHQNGNEFSRVCHIGGKTGDRILFRPVSRAMVLKSTDVSYSLNFLL